MRRVATRARRGRLRWPAVVGVWGVLALAACDSGPQGPGPLTAVVQSPQPLGAVVLEFSGADITGFEQQGPTQVFGVVDAGTTRRHRVILVSPTGATEMRFTVQFVDRRAARPTVVALSAATPANLTVSAAGVKVRIER